MSGFKNDAQRRWFFAHFGQKARARNPEKVKSEIQAERIKRADAELKRQAERLRPVWREHVQQVRAGQFDGNSPYGAGLGPRSAFGPAERAQIRGERGYVNNATNWVDVLERRFITRHKSARYKWPGSSTEMKPAWQWKAGALRK